MVVVNVTVPALEKVYNMNLEEKAHVSDLIAEIVGLISQKEHVTLQGIIEKMVLASKDLGITLNRDSNLQYYGIQTGAELMIV